MRTSTSRTPAVLAAATLLLCAAPARAQWQIDSKDGSTNLKLGFLAQPQAEFLDTADGEHTSQNLYLRRFRLLFGGKISEKWTFFFETDSPNLGKGDTTGSGAKNEANIFVQDAYVTYNHNDAFKIEAGMLLPALCHNCVQSAATLLPVDYGAYSFVSSTPLQARTGRDYGVQLRGYPAKKHLEYRAWVLQGVRGQQSRNALRVGGRLVWYPFEAETGFFYSGTNHASKKILALGGSVETQKSYQSYALDFYYDHPLGGKNGLSLQGNWLHIDGGQLLPSLVEQDTYLLEAGWYAAKAKVSPFVQYGKQNFKPTATADKEQFQVGLAWWLKGHNRNLKAGWGQQHVKGQPDRNQFQVQLQIFMF
jgi:hypothetical protein